ncbi:DUF924 family protein [Sphingomonas sp. CJ99]
MTGDLGADGREVHAGTTAVLDFWLDLPTEVQFRADPDLDRAIAQRFGALRDDVLASDARQWRDDSDALLAAVILLDQFSRNIHRGTAAAFAGDPLALELTLSAIRRGWHADETGVRATFLFMPLMHAEQVALQRFAIECFAAAGLDEQVRFGREHLAVIERFGRFPGRNEALGRATTDAEAEWLSRSAVDW